jgi:hypothetical protein
VSEKYCPAGKCECGNLINISCFIEGQYVASKLYKFEVCPWPSRQQPVQPPVEPPTKDDMTNWRTPQGAFNAGRAYQAGKDKAAVLKCCDNSAVSDSGTELDLDDMNYYLDEAGKEE